MRWWENIIIIIIVIQLPVIASNLLLCEPYSPHGRSNKTGGRTGWHEWVGKTCQALFSFAHYFDQFEQNLTAFLKKIGSW